MNILKIILFSILGLVALVLIAGLFISKQYSCSRSVVINKSKYQVFDFVKYLRNQDLYSKWAKMDPNMKKEFRGTDGEPGAVSSWDGNDKVGKGEQEIKQIKEGERVEYELRFEKPWKSVANSFILVEGVGENESKVTWGIRGESKYPANVMNFMMDGMLGSDLQTGLDNLKALLEKAP